MNGWIIERLRKDGSSYKTPSYLNVPADIHVFSTQREAQRVEKICVTGRSRVVPIYWGLAETTEQ